MNAGARFLSKVKPAEDGSGCLLWTGALSSEGYGRFGDRGKLHQAHRWILEHGYGICILQQFDVDHRCRTRACVRPSHLEIVTRSENLRRSPIMGRFHSTKTHCPQGHAYDEENTYWYRGHRHCLACKTTREREPALRPRRTEYARRYRAQKPVLTVRATAGSAVAEIVWHKSPESIRRSGATATFYEALRACGRGS